MPPPLSSSPAFTLCLFFSLTAALESRPSFYGKWVEVGQLEIVLLYNVRKKGGDLKKIVMKYSRWVQWGGGGLELRVGIWGALRFLNSQWRTTVLYFIHDSLMAGSGVCLRRCAGHSYFWFTCFFFLYFIWSHHLLFFQAWLHHFRRLGSHQFIRGWKKTWLQEILIIQ